MDSYIHGNNEVISAIQNTDKESSVEIATEMVKQLNKTMILLKINWDEKYNVYEFTYKCHFYAVNESLNYGDYLIVKNGSCRACPKEAFEKYYSKFIDA